MAGKTIQELAQAYTEDHVTNLLPVSQVAKLFLKAVAEYQARGNLAQEHQRIVKNDAGVAQLVSEAVVIDESSVIHVSDWGVIKVLAELFCEKEGALLQEASKNHSHDPFGRNSSEIEADIQRYRDERLGKLAFSVLATTI